MTSIGTYVYCLVAAPRRPAAGRVRTRIPGGGPVRVLEPHTPAARELKKWLIVSDVPLNLYGEEVVNRRLSDLDWVSRAAVAHEAVVESFIGAPAVLPMKLFTIFGDDERASAHIAAERNRIDAAVKRVAHHLEWGVRVTLNRSRAVARPQHIRAGASGAAYLAGKKAQRDASAELATRAREVVAGLSDALSKLATDMVRRSASELPIKAGPLLLDAAFLVRRARTARFKAVVARQARELRASGYDITLTGPWPPYSFMRE